MAPDRTDGWRFWIDRGGTFTDVVARRPDGSLATAKLLSEDPDQYDDAAIAAIERLTGAAPHDLAPADIRIGTTIATNALLERDGEPTLLAITRGFGDALLIGTQERPDIFARQIERPAPLYERVVEIDERVDAAGDILIPLDRVQATRDLQAAYDAGLRAIAIVLVHGYRHHEHEQALAGIAREVGFTQISVSHTLAPVIKLIGRGDTTVVDAYLSPILGRYVAALSKALGPQQAPLFMQSNGGLTAGEAFRGKDAILSGPAGGIVGMAETARRAGYDRVIGFDMGGTSTDVSLYAGAYERDSETTIAGARLRTPMLRIHTVAAGGGSVCGFDGARLRVGPRSAGALPGPASYRRGGPFTITDCNVVLGKIQPGFFPAVFGPDGDQPLDAAAARHSLAAVHDAMAAAGRAPPDDRRLAEGLVAIAVADMANAIKAISVARGHDVTRFVLNCFGGAGGQHACLVAEALGIERVLVHPLAGVLSAYGMGLADRREVRERTLAQPLNADMIAAIEAAAEDLAEQASHALAAQGVASDTIRIEAEAHLQPPGSNATIAVALGPIEAMRDGFAAAFRQRFGYDHHGALNVDMLRVEAIAAAAEQEASLPPLPEQSAEPAAVVNAFMAGAACRTPLYERAGLAQNSVIEGPALIVDAVATTVIEPGWRAEIGDGGVMVLVRAAPTERDIVGTALDPVRLEIFAGLFMAIAEEMGAALQHSASSVNIRERLDFSCALFDATGNLIANAPHIPVHLGSMGASVRTIIARRGDTIADGEVYALNSPYDGGTHLPDITVIKPVFARTGDSAPAFFVAARGHHADIGGITPGSMPPDSRTIEDEGILIDNFLLVERGELRARDMRALLARGAQPVRNIDQNIADLAAQVAACERGAAGLGALVDGYGADVVGAYMAHVQDQAEAAVRRLIEKLNDGAFSYALDTGAVVKVAIAIDREARSATVDFAGTSGQQDDNFNAPLAVVRAALLYVVRTMLDDPVPMNDGCLRPFTLLVPAGSMLNPAPPAAVVAGNVEVSQVVTDALFGAFGAMAAAQGTMNNFTFGDADRQYYETIAGGSGAGPDFAGTPAIQTHMTNSRLTDPEILETRFPVIVERFAIRAGSGGDGANRGGDGAIRRLRFTAPMHAAILSNRRRVAPFGLDGGADGASGRNAIERGDGTIEALGGTASAEMAAGDVFIIETPGGGGFGRRGDG